MYSCVVFSCLAILRIEGCLCKQYPPTVLLESPRLGVLPAEAGGEAPLTLTLPDHAGVDGEMLRVARLAACEALILTIE